MKLLCFLLEKKMLSDPVLSSIADAHVKSAAQVILRWNLQKNIVDIPDSSNPEHISENTELFNFILFDEEMTAINSWY